MSDIFKHIEREKLVTRAINQSSEEDLGAHFAPVAAESAKRQGEPEPTAPNGEMKVEQDATFGVARTSLSLQRSGVEQVEQMQNEGMDKQDAAGETSVNDVTADGEPTEEVVS